MRKSLTTILLSIMLVLCIGTTAFAAESTPGVIVGTETETITPSDGLTVESGNSITSPMARAARSDYDLGSNGSISLSISNFYSGTSRWSIYNYKTNSTKIKIAMKSNISISIRVTLYDASTNQSVQQSTVTVGTLTNKTVTFTNLTSSKKYYIKFENLGQQDVNISGTISAT